MIPQDPQWWPRPAGVSILSIALGSMAILQLLATTVLLLFGHELPRFERIVIRFSAFDWAALYLLSGMLAISMKNLFLQRKSAFSWFLAYVGVGSWFLLFYSLSPRREPHFDEIASLAGLLGALAVLAYLFRLRLGEILR